MVSMQNKITELLNAVLFLDAPVVLELDLY